MELCDYHIFEKQHLPVARFCWEHLNNVLRLRVYWNRDQIPGDYSDFIVEATEEELRKFSEEKWMDLVIDKSISAEQGEIIASFFETFGI